jgi:hypothetical protein
MNQEDFDSKYKKLTPRQKEVLEMLLADKTDEEIAKSLREISLNIATVRKYVQQICEIFLGRRPADKKRENRRAKLVSLCIPYKDKILENQTVNASTEVLDPSKNLPTAIEPSLLPSGGILPLGSQLYLERAEEKILRQAFSTHADKSSLFIRIKGGQGTGKTSLLVRLREYLEVEQKQVVGFVDLGGSSFDSDAFSNLTKLLQQFTYAVAQQFKKALNAYDLPDLKDYWKTELPPGFNCSEYLHNHVFSQIKLTKTLIIDGIDAVLGQEKTQTSFLNLLRAFHEEKMKLVFQDQEMCWPHIVIAYSTEPYANYELEGSPLQNVGMPLELSDFNENQVLELTKKFALNWDQSKVKSLMTLIGGHPELIGLALKAIKKDENLCLEKLLSEAISFHSPFGLHLRKHLKLLQNHPKLSQCFRIILSGEECNDEFAKFQLEKAGLIKLNEPQPCVRCELYKTYFSKHLKTDHET